MGHRKAYRGIFLTVVMLVSVVAVGAGPVTAADGIKQLQEPETPLSVSTSIDTDSGAAEDGGPIVARDPNDPVYVGETIAIGFLQEHDGDRYEWEVVNGDDDQLLHTGTTELPDRIPHNGRVTSFRPTEAGTYTIRVTVDRNERYTEKIHVNKDESYFNGQSRHELVQQYAPVLNFHPNEDFYPTRYEAYVENTRLEPDKLGDPTLVDGVTLLDIGADYAPNRDDRWPTTDRTTTHEANRLDPLTSGGDKLRQYQEDVVQDAYPETVYASIHNDVDFKGKSYTAIGYWMVYIHDPKPVDSPVGTFLAKHTGDQEPVFVLIDDQGNPEWVAAQQHNGGELRRWERVETVDDRPVLYVAQGAHSNFFGPDSGETDGVLDSSGSSDIVEYLYQEQFACKGDGGSICPVDNAGEPEPLDIRLATKYTDFTVGGFPGEGDVWTPKSSSGIHSDETYETTFLSGNESWSDYEGDIYAYEGLSDKARKTDGDIPMKQDRWDDTSAYVNASFKPGEQIEVHPDKEQISGSIVNLGETAYSLDGSPDTKKITFENDEFQPHDYVITVETALKTGQSSSPTSERTSQYSAFIGSGEVTCNPKGPTATTTTPPSCQISSKESTVEVPLDLTGDATWDVTVTLSVYPEDVGDGELEQRYELDSRSFDVSSRPDGELNIDRITDGDAGGAKTPQSVRAIVQMTKPDGTPFDGSIRKDRLEITVGDQSVDTEKVIILDYLGLVDEVDKHVPLGSKGLIFPAPTQDAGAGDYDLTVSYDGVTDTEEDAISYGRKTSTQVAASLQIDRSGSMSEVIDEGREGAKTFVGQAGDDDYVSVVSYSTSATIDQDLVRLGEGREDVTTAIEGISAEDRTNIGYALIYGIETLEDAPDGTKKAGILMTDGKRNEGPTESTILNNIVPDYNERGICLYTIGFTEDADEEFMKNIADAANCGGYRFAGESGEVESIQDTLQGVFQDIGGDVTDADTFRSDQGILGANDVRERQFDIDDDTSRMTATIRLKDATSSAQPSQPSIRPVGFDTRHDGVQNYVSIATAQAANNSASITLERPDGTLVSPSDDNVEVSVVGDAIIYRINDPEPGQWTYRIENDGSESEYSAAITGDTQTSLDVTTAGETYYVGDEVDLTATLLGPEGPVENATVEAEVTDPNNGTTTVTLEERSPGVYTGSAAVETNGTYMTTITANRDSLSRTDTTSWTVEETPPISIEQDTEPTSLPGESTTLNVTIGGSIDNNETIVLRTGDLTNEGEDATITDVELETNTIDDAGEVSVSVSIPDDAPAGTYAGPVQAFREDGSVISGQLALTVLEPATFDVEITDAPEFVEEGEEIETAVAIKNAGDVKDEQPVAVSVPGVGTDLTNLSLAAGEDTTENFSVSTASGDAGAYVASATSRDDSDSANVEILGPASFRVEINGALSTTDLNESEVAIVNATVGNVGGEAGNQTVTFRVGDERVSTTRVELDSREVRFVEFTYRVDTADDGRNVTVATEDSFDSLPLSVGVQDNDKRLQAAFSLGSSSIVAGETAQFNASQSFVTAPNGTIESYEWDWTDDGTFETETSDPIATHSFSTAGEKTVRLRVTDEDGATATATLTIGVGGTTSAVDGFENAPGDPDDDGKYEDINGDGSLNAIDAQALLANTDDPFVQNNVSAFDFNDDGSVNVADAQAVFVHPSPP